MLQRDLVSGIAQLGSKCIQGFQGDIRVGSVRTIRVNHAPKLIAMYGNFRWCRDPQPNLIALDTDNGHRQLALRYDDFFAKLTTENEHPHSS